MSSPCIAPQLVTFAPRLSCSPSPVFVSLLLHFISPFLSLTSLALALAALPAADACSWAHQSRRNEPGLSLHSTQVGLTTHWLHCPLCKRPRRASRCLVVPPIVPQCTSLTCRRGCTVGPWVLPLLCTLPPGLFSFLYAAVVVSFPVPIRTKPYATCVNRRQRDLLRPNIQELFWGERHFAALTNADGPKCESRRRVV
jgi:hypothetical protein